MIGGLVAVVVLWLCGFVIKSASAELESLETLSYQK